MLDLVGWWLTSLYGAPYIFASLERACPTRREASEDRRPTPAVAVGPDRSLVCQEGVGSRWGCLVDDLKKIKKMYGGLRGNLAF